MADPKPLSDDRLEALRGYYLAQLDGQWDYEDIFRHIDAQDRQLSAAQAALAALTMKETVTKSANPPITKQQAPRRRNVRGRGKTEVPVMQDKPNELRVRVSYTTTCPEWWRIQVRKRLGKQGLATREECKNWLRDYGTSQDDDLWLDYAAWQEAAEEGEER